MELPLTGVVNDRPKSIVDIEMNSTRRLTTVNLYDAQEVRSKCRRVDHFLS